VRRHELTDEQWARIEHLLPGRPGGHGGVARDNRSFVNAVWFVAKTGIQWRDLPQRFGQWGPALPGSAGPASFRPAGRRY